jgi:hypothetical protein
MASKKLASMSPEEREVERAKRRLYYQQKRASMSEEEKKAQRAKDAARFRLRRQKINMNAEKKKAQRAKQAAYEKKHRQKKRQERASCPDKAKQESDKRKLYRQRKLASMSPEERQAKRVRRNALSKTRRLQRKYAEDESAEESCGYEIGVATTSPIQQARYHDQKRIMGVDGKPDACRAAVCVLCDRFIIGCESINKLTVESLCSQEKRISVKSYEDYHGVNLKKELVSQYQISGHEELEGLLLSPRAKQIKTKDGHVAFEACSSCYGAWQNKDCDSPPKLAISNGFAIGHVPTDVIKDNIEITEQMSSILAPVRPFAHICIYSWCSQSYPWSLQLFRG